MERINRTAVENTLSVDQRRISEMGTGPIQYNINIQYVLSTVRLQNTALSEAGIRPEPRRTSAVAGVPRLRPRSLEEMGTGPIRYNINIQ